MSDETLTAGRPNYAELLHEARDTAGYSIDDLAIATGLTRAEIASIENGSDVDENRLWRCASVLKVALGILSF